MFFGISVLVFSLISILKIPPKIYSNFVFWNYEPFILILCVLSTVVHLISLISIFGFSRCWHGSITFLIFILFLTSIVVRVLAGTINENIDTIIPTLVEKNEFGKNVNNAVIELNCSSYQLIKDFPFDVLSYPGIRIEYNYILVWNTTNGLMGCHDSLKKEFGNIQSFQTNVSNVILGFMTVDFVLNLFISLFITEYRPESEENEDVE